MVNNQGLPCLSPTLILIYKVVNFRAEGMNYAIQQQCTMVKNAQWKRTQGYELTAQRRAFYGLDVRQPLIPGRSTGAGARPCCSRNRKALPGRTRDLNCLSDGSCSVDVLEDEPSLSLQALSLAILKGYRGLGLELIQYGCCCREHQADASKQTQEKMPRRQRLDALCI